jgi:hypothetical protein
VLADRCQHIQRHGQRAPSVFERYLWPSVMAHSIEE